MTSLLSPRNLSRAMRVGPVPLPGLVQSVLPNSLLRLCLPLSMSVLPVSSAVSRSVVT